MIRLVAYRAVAWRELPIATSDSPITEQLVRIKQLGYIAAVTRFAAPRERAPARLPARAQRGRLSDLDLKEIATALADRTDYERRWLIDPRTEEVAFWTSDLGIDGQNPVDLDDLDLICIDPLPSYVWYQDMADFAERISDHRAGQRLARAIEGRGAFRRFEDELHRGPAGGVVRLPRRPRPTPCRRLARR
jgi:hypothetical protein